jgi:prolipoprotein diacylglyceryl transferase
MHPVLFSIGETPIHAYGFLIAVALILGWILSLRFARIDKLPADQLGTGYVLSVAGGLLAARIMWLTQHPEVEFGMGTIIQLQAGGLSGFGGVLTGLIIGGVFCQNKKIPPWAWLDCAAPAFLIGVVLERIGAFLAGADVGHYLDPEVFLAVQFPIDSLAYEIQRRDLAGMRVPVDTALPVHPSQLYAAAAAAVAAGLSFVVRGRRQYSGQVALFALASFAVTRYLIEDPFRYDMTPEIAGPITLGQAAALAIVAVVVVVHFMRAEKAQLDPANFRQWLGGPWTPGAETGKSSKKSSRRSAAEGSSKKSGKKKSKKSPSRAATETTPPKAESADESESESEPEPEPDKPN